MARRQSVDDLYERQEFSARPESAMARIIALRSRPQ